MACAPTWDMTNALVPVPKNKEQGKVGYALAWLLGVPIPILLAVYLFSRCV